MKEGYLAALGQKGKEWKSRYFLIKENFLHYFKKKGDKKPDGVIPLESCFIGVTEKCEQQDKAHCFELVACNRSYLLASNSAEDSAEWVAAIQRAASLTIEDFYDIKETLGTGTFSKVKRGCRRKDNVDYAIKIIDKVALVENRESLLTEISILKLVKHPNVIGLVEIFETRRKLYLVMEMLTGGELFDRIVERGFFSEKYASSLIKKVVHAIQYLHTLGICHRDLKPENLLYSNGEDDAEIKIADFGLSKFVSQDPLKTACGTPGYVAPEVLDLTGYGKPVDMWSVGVILYILLCGFPPFYADSDAEMFEFIKQARFDFPQPYWTNISPAAKDLVCKLLEKDPEKRYTTTEVLNHPWISGNAAPDEQNELVIETMRRFNARRKFRQGIQGVIATQRFTKALTNKKQENAAR